ncbi:MAG: hypothetical protein E7K85_13685 [Clostridium sp.]|uniref:hypothetical protein n=1 Tax=Clostridium TaxID=1485 RepID=UPI000C085988|nr:MULTISPECIES: hypothetical protein [Clostridium]MDB2121276.1 hypothetical protein [Clostridium paraputrificum]MDU2756096.1 hypothetical protein [Clostridium sp.]MDU2901498.1 hypothetical protein [Clostridium sp.]MDU4428156.1 hypothetical protein [Clostridium sp.]MDU7461671.1 hypothetical protein [Clostridium sp.]
MKGIIIWFLANCLITYFVNDILLTALISFFTFPFLFDNFIKQIMRYRNKEIKLNTLLNIGVNYVGGNIIEFIVINIGINLVNGAYSMYVNNNTYEILSLILEIILGIIMIIGGLQLIRDKINKEKIKNRTSM